MNGPIVQLCPSDQAPFQVLCKSLSLAAERLGRKSPRIFLRAPRNLDALDPAAHYLKLQQPEDYRISGPAVAAAVLDACGETPPALILAHRYRSYRVARAAGLPNTHTLVVAHEFGLLDRLQRRADRALHGRGVRFAGVSPAVAEDLARHTGETLLLSNALHTTQFVDRLASRSEARVNLGIADHRFVVGFVGRLAPVKRPALALAAINALQEQDTELVFIGDGELRDDLLRASGDSAVRFLGHQGDVTTLLAGLDALLLTTGAAEGFSLAALEAMLAGVPVVTPPSPGLAFVTGELGIISDDDSATAIAASLRRIKGWSPQERDRWGEAARMRAHQQFGIAALAKQLGKLIPE